MRIISAGIRLSWRTRVHRAAVGALLLGVFIVSAPDAGAQTLAAGWYHSAAIPPDGTAWTWGTAG